MPTKRPNYTRFNPTTNGALHIGHLYMILVNEAEAHASGGKFVVRFDDSQEAYQYGVSWTGFRMTTPEILAVKDNMMYDLEWMGVRVDEWQSQITMRERMEALFTHLNKGTQLRGVRTCYTSQINPEMHWCNFDVGYPYFPQLTAEKVLYDFLSGSNLIIRGDDLLDEWSLYYYFCDIWGIPFPHQVFLKRLRLEGGIELLDISKTRGGSTIHNYRERGWKPEDLKRLLAIQCLIDPDGPWLIDNLKPEPTWDEKQ